MSSNRLANVLDIEKWQKEIKRAVMLNHALDIEELTDEGSENIRIPSFETERDEDDAPESLIDVEESKDPLDSQLDITETVSTLPAGMKLDQYDGYDHQKNYSARGEAYYNGFKLMLDHMPAEKFNKDTKINRANKLQLEQLKQKVIESCEKYYENYRHALMSVNNFHDGEACLRQYLDEVRNAVEEFSLDETISKQLLAAENLVTWGKGRHVLATVSEHQYTADDGQKKNQTIVQVEIPRCRLTKAQEEEYKKIVVASKNDKLPKWFEKMPGWQQDYLKKMLQPMLQGKQASDLLKTIPTTFRGVPGLANYSEHVLLVYEDGELKSSSHRTRSGIVTAIDLAASEDVCKLLTRQNIAQVISTSLSENIANHIKTWGAPNEAMIDLPVLFQTLVSPGLITSFAGKKSSEDLMHRYKEKAIQKISAAFQDLEAGTPKVIAAAKARLQSYGFEINDNNRLVLTALNGEAYQVRPHFISTNRTFNRTFAQLKDITKAEMSNDPNAVSLVQQAAEFLETHLENSNLDFSEGLKLLKSMRSIDELDPVLHAKANGFLLAATKMIQNEKTLTPQQKKNITTLLQALQQYVDFPKIIARDNQSKNPLNRRYEFFYASLEQIIVESMNGLAYGSCKSGKDRKGTEILHTDAMHIYFSRYGELPQYEDDAFKRGLFCEIFADLYYTRHQQFNAQENAPGSMGLKGVHKSLPDDLKAAINSRFPGQSDHDLEECNHFANLNKPGEELSAKLKHIVQQKLNIENSESKELAVKVIEAVQKKSPSHSIMTKLLITQFAASNPLSPSSTRSESPSSQAHSDASDSPRMSKEAWVQSRTPSQSKGKSFELFSPTKVKPHGSKVAPAEL